MKLEDKMKKEFNKYEIKTSSNDILEKYHERQENKKSLFSFNFKPLAITFASLALLIYPAIKLFNGNQTSQSTSSPGRTYIQNHATEFKDSNVISRTALEVYLGGLMNNSSSKRMKRFSSNDEFNYAIEKYNKVSTLIKDIYSKEKTGLDSIYESIEFNYEEINYNYKLTVESFELYSEKDFNKDEFKGNVLLCLNNNYYFGNLEIEKEIDETEVTLSYTVDNKTIIIEREQETDEFSIEYSVMENKSLISSSEIEFEYDNNNQLDIEYSYFDDEENYEIVIKDETTLYQEIEFTDHKKSTTITMTYNKETNKFEKK